MKRSRKEIFYYFFILALMLVLLYLSKKHIITPHFLLNNEALLSGAKIFEIMLAISMAVILYQKGIEKDRDPYFWILSGFLSYAIISIYHLFASNENDYLILSATSHLLCSIGFILTPLPVHISNKNPLLKKIIIFIAAAFSIIFGIILLYFPQIFPVMIENGKFTNITLTLFYISGFLYITASLLFLFKYNTLDMEGDEFYLFALVSMIFGITSFAYKYSLLWDDIWWVRRIERLIGFLVLSVYLVFRYFAMMSDLLKIIYKYKRAEEIIKESEGKYRTMIENSNDLIWTLDRDGNYTYINKRAEEVSGFKLADLIGRYFGLMIFPSDLAKVQKTFIETLEGKFQNYEVNETKKDGTYFILSVNTAPLYEAGKIIGTVSFGRNITEQRATENELWETHGYLEKLFSYANVPIVVWDTKSNITRFNHAFERLTGYKADEVIGKKLEILFPEESINKVLDNINLTLTGKHWESVEIPILCKDENLKITLWNSANIYAKDAKTLVAIIAQGQDITERKNAEKEIKEALERIKRSLNESIRALSYLSEQRDPFTAGHQVRVAKIATFIGKEMGLSEERIDEIMMAGLLHDIGKISIPAEILTKPGRLNELEMKLIKTHSKVGFDIVKEIEFPWPVMLIILQHHERINGSGYPKGLKGDDIMLESRILAVADVVEAMSSHRPYRPAFSIIEALEEISKNKGVLYDFKAADACLRLFYKKELDFLKEEIKR